MKAIGGPASAQNHQKTNADRSCCIGAGGGMRADSKLRALRRRFQVGATFMKRRFALKAACAALAVSGLVSLPALAADTIKIGVLHGLSGTMAISETVLKDTVLMTVDEINA